MNIAKTTSGKVICFPLKRKAIASFDLRELVEVFGVALHIRKSKSNLIGKRLRKSAVLIKEDIEDHFGSKQQAKTLIAQFGFSSFKALQSFAREIIFEEFR